MQSNMDEKLTMLEQNLGEQLRRLPPVRPSQEWEQRLWQEITAKPRQTANQQRRRSWRQRLWWPQASMVAAALVLVLLSTWLAGVWRTTDQTAALGPLLLPTAQAQSNGALSFRLGLGNTLRNIDFVTDGLTDVKPLPRELPVQRLQMPNMSSEDVQALAQRLGIEPEADFRVDGQMVIVEGRQTKLCVHDRRLGIWWLDQEGTAVEGVLDQASAEKTAVDWLRQVELLPEQPYTVDSREDGRSYWVRVRPLGPQGEPFFGHSPGYDLVVAPGNQVLHVYGAWYQPQDIVSLPVMDWQTAIDALRNGEGELEAAGFSPYNTGQVQINAASIGYQVAYALDYTPYYVPVAVFTGQYQGEKGEPSPCTAYVPLLRYETRPNAGNFQLQTELPQAPAHARVAQERPLAASESELPALAAFFGLQGAQVDEYGVWHDGQGSSLSTTSWDGGWLWRGRWASSQANSGPVSEQQAMAIAQEVAEQLPVLPGEVGEFFLQDNGELGFYWVTAGFLYDGLLVEDPNRQSPRSYLAVQVDKETGYVTAVNCALPLQLRQAERTLLSPQAAWQKLLQNEAVVNLQGGYSAFIPAVRFLVDESLVTEVQLVYVPRDPNFMRNEFYDLKYCFRGIARQGELEIPFTALVDAER